MSYRLRYSVNIDWVGPGTGPMSGNTAGALGSNPAGGAQTLNFANAAGGQNSLTFVAADITALLAAMSADLSAQMNTAATLARIQAFASGGG